MSKLLSQILLALLMFPVMGIFWFFCFRWFYNHTAYDFADAVLVSAAVTWGCVVIYWSGLWRRSVRWAAFRILGTILAGVLAAAVGWVVGWSLLDTGRRQAYFVGTSATMVAWLIATVLLWRETAAERSARVRCMGGGGAVVCPACGYNLTGLAESRCPECGARYTLDELMAAQPGRVEATATKELET